MRILSKALIGAGLACALALPASAQLAVGPDAGGYLCPDGRQLYVKSCYDQSPNANCGIVQMHLPLSRGYQPETMDIRANVAKSVAGCRVYPLTFRDGIVSLVVPKNADQTPAPAGGSAGTIVLPGSDGRARSLVRLPEAANKAIVYYLDENSRTPIQADVARIWTVWVYPQGLNGFPGVTAHWAEYIVNCKTSSFEINAMIGMDRQGKLLSAQQAGVKEQIKKGSVSEIIAGAACQRGGKLNGARLTTAVAAISDGMAAPAAKPVTMTYGGRTVTVPGTNGPLSLTRLIANKEYAHYVERSLIKPGSRADVVNVWQLTVYPNGQPGKPTSGGVWYEYFLNCKTYDLEIGFVFQLDNWGVATSGGAMNIKDKVEKNTPVELVSDVACQRLKLSAPGLTTLQAAFEDARANAR